MENWPTSQWLLHQEREYFSGGGSILITGWRCEHCNHFQHRKSAMTPYCSSCGYRMVNCPPDQ